MSVSTPDDVIRIARLFDYVREAPSLGQNQGSRVNGIQIWSLGHPADSWCAEYATWILDIAYKGAAPIPRMGSCQAILDLARSKGMVRTTPKPGMLFLYVNAAGHAHHVGIVTLVDAYMGTIPPTPSSPPLVHGIAGNTSADGLSSNGDRVAEHAISISASVFIDYMGAAPK